MTKTTIHQSGEKKEFYCLECGGFLNYSEHVYDCFCDNPKRGTFEEYLKLHVEDSKGENNNFKNT